ncbi:MULTISPECIES: hypothetical protein [Streptomyces]|uniref:Uncharacterized protein n=1 Tax=Streptomyces stelliscabiei TaxID=146820 RepID=A0A8I0P5F5_9ACTN|nr:MULTISPECIES: hypothetical protein [Streptomyces]KND28600.1 hypothetical protein IQ64_43480 [Streptomyces stelliscabiei]MBE1599878.1 hypothetical protein [Streptomyces stelliscabiei]MDX2515952.1 hypothetical protein [Streptomyces stelliscabiei]MDX2549538.1 hypothetical protein [Streptomyces stelliscabiei]MDX2611560.1 hypothetical protein [Streptomyces stelliscabiei]
MTDPSLDPVPFARAIAAQIGQLSQYLAQAPPREAAHILATVLDRDVGILGHVTHLMETGSRFAKHTSELGILPPEVWLAVGRAANELHSVGGDLDEHTDVLDALASTVAPAPSTTPKPVPSAMVVRRRR